MMVPHSGLNVIRTNNVEHGKESDSGLYLVSSVNNSISADQIRIKSLEEKLRQATLEIARLNASVCQKEQLLQNFHIREQELKASLFQPVA